MTNSNDILVKEIIHRLKKYKIKSYKPLIKGYSNDIKFTLETDKHQNILMKVSSIDMKDRKLEEFKYISVHYKNGVKCPQAIEFICFDDLGVCIMLLSFIEGESAESVLHTICENEQYKIGYEASKELRKIHTVENSRIDTWYADRWEKYMSKKKKLYELGIGFDNQNVIEDYIEKNYSLLKKSTIRFQHDDFHPMNIILKQGKFQGVIDFDRFSWGDPIEDFFKIPKYTLERSLNFSLGQIDGYFDKDVPQWFWRKYNLFVALNFHASFIGATLYNNVEEVRKRQNEIFSDHDFVNHGAPSWYKKLDII